MPYAGAYRWSYRGRLGTKVFQKQWSHKSWFGGGGFDYVTPAPFSQRAAHARRDNSRKYATIEQYFRRFHKAQRPNVSLKPREGIRKVLPDREPVQSFAARASLDARARGNDAATTGEPLENSASVDIERKPEETIGPTDGFQGQPQNLSAEVAQVNSLPTVEDESVPAEPLVARAPDELAGQALLTVGSAARSWRQSLPAILGAMVVFALGLVEFLVRRPVESWDVKFIDLKSKTPAELVSFAEENGVVNASTMLRQELLFAILKQLRAPDKVAADPGVTSAVAADPSAASALTLAIVFSSVALASMAAWLYVLGAGTFKLVSWLFS
jgi:hypothetical protein